MGLPNCPPGRRNQLVLACDPGEHMGFALVQIDPVLRLSCVRASKVLAMSTSLQQAASWLRDLPLAPIVLIEDQYRGKASVASATTLSQRAGHISGFLVGAGVPEENIIFVTPQAWYKAVGMPPRVTKAVCMSRIEASLTPDERAVLETICEVYPHHRMDVLAAIGIGWAFPYLSASTLARGQKMRALKPRTPTPSKATGRKVKAVRRSKRMRRA